MRNSNAQVSRSVVSENGKAIRTNNNKRASVQEFAMTHYGRSTRLNAVTRSRMIRPVAIVISVMMLLLTGCASIPDKPSENERSVDTLAIFQTRQQALIAYQQSRWIEAVRLYQQVVAQIPEDADAWFRLGNTFAQQGVYQRAIHAYQQSLNHNGEQPKVWFNLSTAYLLNAQAAMRGAHARLRASDPAKQLIAERLNSLDALVHGRFEESVAPAALSR